MLQSVTAKIVIFAAPRSPVPHTAQRVLLTRLSLALARQLGSAHLVLETRQCQQTSVGHLAVVDVEEDEVGGGGGDGEHHLVTGQSLQ